MDYFNTKTQLKWGIIPVAGTMVVLIMMIVNIFRVERTLRRIAILVGGFVLLSVGFVGLIMLAISLSSAENMLMNFALILGLSYYLTYAFVGVQILVKLLGLPLNARKTSSDDDE